MSAREIILKLDKMRSRHSLQNNGRPVLCCQAFLWSYTLGAFVANNDAGLLSEYAEKLRRIGRSLGKCEYQEHIWHHLRLIKGVMKNPKVCVCGRSEAFTIVLC